MVNLAKIEVVNSWDKPTSPAEVRCFIRLPFFYRRFIEEFSSIAPPLTRLIYKDVPFQRSV